MWQYPFSGPTQYSEWIRSEEEGVCMCIPTLPLIIVLHAHAHCGEYKECPSWQIHMYVLCVIYVLIKLYVVFQQKTSILQMIQNCCVACLLP